MSLEEIINRVDKGMKMLQEEIQQIKKEAEILEEENRLLRQHLNMAGDEADLRVAANSLKIQQTAQENLVELYRGGNHICHLFFGRERKGECLFCRGVLGE